MINPIFILLFFLFLSGQVRSHIIKTLNHQCWHMRESKTESQRDLFAGWCLWALVVLDCVWHRSTRDAQFSLSLSPCFRFRHARTHTLTLLFSVRKAYVTTLCSFRSFLRPGQPFNTDSSIFWRQRGRQDCDCSCGWLDPRQTEARRDCVKVGRSSSGKRLRNERMPALSRSLFLSRSQPVLRLSSG